MNQHIRPSSLPRTTQAADGFPRRAWTVDEIEFALGAGVFDPDERFELIGGEIVPMSPEGGRHAWIKEELEEFFHDRKPRTIKVVTETTVRLDDLTLVVPEFCFYSRDVKRGHRFLSGSEVLLIVEVADSTLRFDLGRKVEAYAAAGVREVWVVNANTLATRVHRLPGANGYGEKDDISHTRRMTPTLFPDFALRVADLGLKPLKPKR
jgi:Uma2 family endonuclease